VVKAFALKPSEPDEAWGSGSSCGAGCGFGWSVIVLDEDAREDDEGRRTAVEESSAAASCAGWGGGEGDESGFAMRRPPSDCERLRSPFIVARTRNSHSHWADAQRSGESVWLRGPAGVGAEERADGQAASQFSKREGRMRELRELRDGVGPGGQRVMRRRRRRRRR